MSVQRCGAAWIACLALLLSPALPAPALAGEVAIEGARAEHMPDGSWRFSVTLRHADTGWEHYADRWEILGPDGSVLATRVLLHPHVDEQPFTRSLGGVRIPEGVQEVRIRAHDTVHGYSSQEYRLVLKP